MKNSNKNRPVASESVVVKDIYLSRRVIERGDVKSNPPSKPSINYNMFNAKSTDYNYQEPGGLELLENTSRLYFPVEVDTEFTQPKWDIKNPIHTINKTITVQCRSIHKSEGEIFTHPDVEEYARHPVLKHGFAPVDYLESQGYQVSLRQTKRVTNLPVIQFDIYGFFLVAELYRMVQGEFVKDIDKLVRAKDSTKGQIEMGRRLLAKTRVSNKKEEQWCYVPWILTINGIELQVALRFYDTCAIHGNTSYAELCKNCGVELKYKDTFTKKEKGDMLRMYRERPEDFDNYSLGDLYNYDCLMGNQEKFNFLYKTFSIGNYIEPPRLTIGATVERFVKSIALHLFGIDMDAKKEIIDLCKYGTAKHLKELRQDTGVYLAKVDGGRCRNNRPTSISVNGLIADADIKGCYGNGLKHQDYPFGRPMIIDYPIKSDNNDYQTLRKFIKQYRKYLSPGLWCARVSTKPGYELKYPQDFIVSWFPPKNPANIPTDTIMEGLDWWDEKNVGVTKILTREVNLGVITEEFLDWLYMTCSPRQRNEILDNLEVISVAFYPNLLHCDSYEELIEKLKNFKGKNKTKGKVELGDTHVTKIFRPCYSWISANLGEMLVTRLLEERSKYSKSKPDEKPLNTLFKLVINTIYGDMVSPFFDMGNTIVGNNITARARAMAWYMEKGLHGYQTITDGCAFDINRVIKKRGKSKLTSESTCEAYTKEDKGSFNLNSIGDSGEIGHYITQIYDAGKDNCVDKVALIVDGEKLDYNESLNWLSDKVSEHLKEQFPDVPVIEKFKFEIKDIYTSATFHGTANYKFWIGDHEQKAKMRSYKKDGHESYRLLANELELLADNYIPSEEFLSQLLTSSDKLDRSRTYLNKKILKPGEYRKNYDSRWEHSEAFPGCTVENARLFRECSLTLFTFRTKKQYDSWEREQKRLRDKYGQSYEMWFLEEGKLNYKKMVETLDKMIREGAMKFTDSRKAARHYNLHREYIEHPEFETLNATKHQLDIRFCRVDEVEQCH